MKKINGMKKVLPIAAGVLALLIVVFSAFTIVSPGSTGVVVTMGAVSEKVLSEGIHLKIPFVQSVIQVNNRTQKIETEGTASSKDLQIITYVVAVNYRVNNDSSASLYKNVGTQYETVIITPAIQESIKAVTAQYTAEELITKLEAAIRADLRSHRMNVSFIVNESLFNGILKIAVNVIIVNVREATAYGASVTVYHSAAKTELR